MEEWILLMVAENWMILKPDNESAERYFIITYCLIQTVGKPALFSGMRKIGFKNTELPSLEFVKSKIQQHLMGYNINKKDILVARGVEVHSNEYNQMINLVKVD